MTGNQAAHDPVKDSIITEWSSGMPISRNVPDPATLVFLGLGLVGIGIMRWRQVFDREIVFKSMSFRDICALFSSPGSRNL